ncbi:hypothetical protein ACFSLT_31980 [Novosphingobium resinovorum]
MSGLPMALPSLVHSICAAIIIVSLALSLTGVLTLANEQYQRRPEAGNRPIKGYVQVAKLLVYGATAILVIAALMDQSPCCCFRVWARWRRCSCWCSRIRSCRWWHPSRSRRTT